MNFDKRKSDKTNLAELAETFHHLNLKYEEDTRALRAKLVERNVDNLLFLHVGTTIILIGTESQCHNHIDAAAARGKPLQWDMSTPAEFATYCFDAGWEAASYETFA